MRRNTIEVLLLLSLLLPSGTLAQVTIHGRVGVPRFPGSNDTVLIPDVLVIAGLDGPGNQAMSFRTWGTEPVGWYQMWGNEGKYSVIFTGPHHFIRPIAVTNAFLLNEGEELKQRPTPRFDYAVMFEAKWDDKPASDYYQTFVANGRSVTQVGFKLAHDGIDGEGPGAQDLLVSIHRKGNGTPDAWEQVGPAVPVLGVDAGGAKNYTWSAGWDSGEVPTRPGEVYAVHLATPSGKGKFQPFWRPDPNNEVQGECYRVSDKGRTGFTGCDLWTTVAGDGDGLLIPYNKRVHRQYHSFAGSAHKWSQTYVSQGRGAAAVVLYAAVSGAQPPLPRQRVAVRFRRGGPDGPRVGVEKIAIGNGIYTGDASWGCFSAAHAPGEVPLDPGQTYAVEFESIENHETLHGFVNIKGEVSNDIPAFNPYVKYPPDRYEKGRAYRNGTDATDVDLDMQIIEYEFPGENWAGAVDAANLVKNGDMETGTLPSEKEKNGTVEVWKTFAIDPNTSFHYLADGKDQNNRIVRIIGGGINGKTVDGGYIQRVAGLKSENTYRLSGRVRCSWIVDQKHQCYIGFDPTGQQENPKADTIVWTKMPNRHGDFVPYRSEPIRPKRDAISVWLRGRTTLTVDAPFKADFDDFVLRRVLNGPPDGTHR